MKIWTHFMHITTKEYLLEINILYIQTSENKCTAYIVSNKNTQLIQITNDNTCTELKE